VLPPSLIRSLQGIKGFDKEAFEAVHQSGEQVTSIRINPFKLPERDSGLPTDEGDEGSSLVTVTDENVPWCPYGRYLSRRPSFTFDPVFHAGAYYVQEASSMFLWEILKQTAGESAGQRVLDLCAAPGGKSTLLATFFSDGWIVANEVIKPRAVILTENIIKWGSGHVVVTNNDPKDFQRLENYFDVVVIDAPCSGSGLFRKDPGAVKEWSEESVKHCSLRQQRIITDVLPALKENGLLIYSTCSYSREENEDILDWIIDKYRLSSVNCLLPQDYGIVETQSSQHGAWAYRFFPYKVKGEGFFIAAFKKTGGGTENRYSEQLLTFPGKQELQRIGAFISLPPDYSVFKHNDSFRAIRECWLKDIKLLAQHLYIKKAGIELGCIKGKDFIPAHELAVGILPLTDFPKVPLGKQQAVQYLRKGEIKADASKGWCLVTYCGLPLGWIKVLPNRVNNYYPGEWRILKD
jgi:16S rRNA C967 or C1407 C5-methylase (RsmB/RsmF family)/NOL1/NOP2/fmu family ribosome biogenesis protein